MKKIFVSLSALSLLTIATGSYASTESVTTFTAEQQAEIGKIATSYLIEHPDFLVKASQKLQQQQQEKQSYAIKNAVIKNQDTLLNDPQTPFVGLKTAKVSVIEFFDYQCSYCSKVSPSIEKLQKAYPKVKFIYKETPIFGERWEPSKYAAQMGLEVFAQKGSTAYSNYHNGIFNSGLNEGKLTKSMINKKAQGEGVDISKFKVTDSYRKNLKLFYQLGFRGTPAFIVMLTTNATVDNTFVINGADISAVQEAIKSLVVN